jgi:RHS repeat-associated protein
LVNGPGLDEPICLLEVAESNAVYYYHFDGLGSVVALSDVNSVLVERYTYDVFGRPAIRDANGTEIAESAFANPYLFTGRAYDAETGLYYYRARYYDYATARFLQADAAGYTDGLSLYAYVGNNPTNVVDPHGTFGIPKWAYRTAADALDFVLPDARIINVSGTVGPGAAPGVGVQIVENYRSGEVSAFGYYEVAAGYTSGDLSYLGGFVWALPQNSDYRGGFISGEFALGIPSVNFFCSGNSGIGPAGGTPRIDWSGPKGFAAGPSLSIPGFRVTFSEFSQPVDLPLLRPGDLNGTFDLKARLSSLFLTLAHKLRAYLAKKGSQ